MLFGVPSDQLREMEDGKIIATGVGRRAVEPTIVSIRLKVEDRLPTAAQVQASVAEKCSTLLSYLRADEAVTKLETSGVYLAPQFDYGCSPPVVTGYTANNNVSFELPVARTGAILSGAITNGATAITRVSFKATEEVAQQARLDAVKDAVRKASAEASAAAQAAELAIEKTSTVRVDDSFSQGTVVRSEPMTFGAPARNNKMAPAHIPVMPAEQVICARVTVTFQTK